MDGPGRLRTASGDGDADGGRSLRSRLSPVGLRGLALAVAAAVAGTALGGVVPVFGALGRLAGLLLAGFGLGLAGRCRYAEVGIAGATVGAVATVLGALGPLLLPLVADYGTAIGGVGAGTGLLVSLAGHYFGRDLRAGFTREV
ncbi:MAG: hypothetical protein ABEJ34_09110 [Haloferacaceae archaeon]